MGKGGGAPPQSAQPQQVTTSTSNLPEYAEPFFTRLLEQSEAVTGEDYIPIEQQRLADFSDRQVQSFDQASNLAQSGIPEEYGVARDRLQQTVDFQPGYTPGAVNAGQFTDPGVAQSYMNPFIENVLDVQQSRARRQFEEDQGQRVSDAAVRSGAFGGSREGIANQLARERFEDRLSDQEATQRARAFDSAQKAFGVDQTAGLRAAALREESGQQAGRLGIAGEELGIRGAAALGQLGEGELGLGLRQADVLRQIGEQEQALEQQQFDIGVSDFISQRDFPRQQLAFQSGILRGIPVSPVSETAQFQAQPSSAQQMLGFGLGGLGLAKSIFG
tara:strand:- start:696 stop:1691 length:996 start_codon:yes stop_codon:yes gene_type:complete